MMKHKIIAGLVLGLGLSTASHAQVKPAESTSKVKKVMRFTKIAGWKHVDGQRDMEATLTKLAGQKGFTVTNVANDAQLTLDFLKQFQVILWDNNVDGGGSVPSTAARTAVLDYVDQGGGWLLVHGAADHKNTWPGLQAALATTFSRHGSQGPADIIFDTEGIGHPELKWMMEGWPKSVRFSRDEWYGFQNTVRGRPGMVIIATAANGSSGVLIPPADGSKDHTYIFAKPMGKGRMLYTSLGHGGNDFYNQAEGFATKALWEHIRYVAGDFENGCMDQNHAAFNPSARVPGACGTVGISGSQGGGSQGGIKTAITVVHGQRRTQLNFPHESRFSVEVRDALGTLVWSRNIENVSEVRLDPAMRPGMYHLVAKAGKNVIRHRFLVM